ncbi:hypothetical protein BGX34_006557 [Mortierella sp. NVP85]|nr:hypothetical protein BGX34_006557 [Mortierella sp. NVP85]
MASKSVFSGKKTTRAVLPDSTLTARSHLLAGIAKSGAPGSPKKDGKRETKPVDSKQQHSQQPKQREPTADTSSTTTNTGSMTGAQSKANASNSVVATTNLVPPPPAVSRGTTPFAANGTEGESNDPESSSSTTAVVERLSADQSSNPFLVPAPVHPQPQQLALPEWAQNQSKRRSNHEKTILPSITDEGRDEEDTRSDIPDWAKRDALDRTMEMQNHMNPEDIFGPLPTLVMSEVFPNYNARRSSRPRTSSSVSGALSK